MTDDPSRARVDVIIPLYNKRAVVNRAVRSVVKQTMLEWSLIIVDDGSSDGWSLDPELASERITVVVQENAGPGAARNRGAAQGDAPFLAFLDADDEWEPEFLDRLVSTLSGDSSLGAAASSWSGDRAAGDINQLFASRGVGEGKWVFSPTIAPAAFKARIDSIHSSATVVRRTVFEECGGFYENRSTYGEDSFLWVAVALRSAIHRTQEKLIRFHVDNSSLSVGRGSAYPIPPILLDWKVFRARAGEVWQPFMPRYLGYYATVVISRSLHQGAVEQAHSFLRSGTLRKIGVDRRTVLALRARVLRARIRVLASRHGGS
jgi:glycosyltransferase involved in cell wall biosynthesis